MLCLDPLEWKKTQDKFETSSTCKHLFLLRVGYGGPSFETSFNRYKPMQQTLVFQILFGFWMYFGPQDITQLVWLDI